MRNEKLEMVVAAAPQIYMGRCLKDGSQVTSHQSPVTHFCFKGTTGSAGLTGEGGGFAGMLVDGIPVSRAFPSRGRCPGGADRAQAVCKRDGIKSPSP